MYSIGMEEFEMRVLALAVHWLVSRLLILYCMGSKLTKRKLSIQLFKKGSLTQTAPNKHLVSDVTVNWILTICLAG